MRNFLSGAVLGLLLGAVLTYGMMGRESPAASSNASTIKTMPNATATAPHAVVDPRMPSLTPSSAPSATASVADASSSARHSTTTNLFPAAAPSTTAQSAPPIAKSRAVVEPIKVSEAHREILSLDDDAFANQHAQLEAQARDDSWSYFMEQMLGSYFGSRAPGLGIEIVNIACRSTMCELQVFCENGIGNLENLMYQASKEPWWQFDRKIGRQLDLQSRLAVVMFLERAQKNSER